MSRLIVVSNRVALSQAQEGKPAAGGLAIGVLDALRENGGIWFGWSGEIVSDASPMEINTQNNVTYVTVGLTRRDYDQYYRGFSNATLWPTFHYRNDLSRYDRQEYEGYQRVNHWLANRLIPLLAPDDLIWVHDYHLIPFGQACRNAGVSNPIGFFLHIPFPVPEVLRMIPPHNDLIQALCEYNLVGFQTHTDLQSFTDFIMRDGQGAVETFSEPPYPPYPANPRITQSVPGAPHTKKDAQPTVKSTNTRASSSESAGGASPQQTGQEERLRLRNTGKAAEKRSSTVCAYGRCLKTGVYPISIYPDAIAKAAQRYSKRKLVLRLKESLRGRKLIISVDRLDYSKGLVERFQAFERLLQNVPTLQGNVTFMQIAPPTRSDLQTYQRIRKNLEGEAGRINGRFAQLDWTPIRYLNRKYERNILMALLRVSHVGYVTPLRDGMNLVAKEYVAAQDPNDPGVLVLSQFAGAVDDLPGAIVVNPFDIGQMADALAQALTMPISERQARYADTMQLLREKDLSVWRDAFVGDLRRCAMTPIF